jgi:hypothetical protein
VAQHPLPEELQREQAQPDQDYFGAVGWGVVGGFECLALRLIEIEERHVTV